MAWFNKNRKPEEQRTITWLPWGSGGPKPSEVTVENAASLVPVFACTRILADNIASFPVEAFHVSKGDLTPQKFIPPLFYSPSARDDRFVWMHKCVVSLCLRGNAYGLVVERDKLGFPSMVEWLFPDDVFVDETSPIDPIYYWQGKRQNTSDIVHIPWVTMPGRVVGMSPIRYFASTLGVGLAASDYGRRWFDSGGAPPAVLKNTSKTINQDEAKEIRKRAVQSIRSGEPFVTGNDWDFTAIQVNAEESQFLATMKLNATQIAAIYGVPPTMVSGESGGSMTYANVEQEANNLITLTFRPWLVRLETAFSALLANAEEVRFNVDSMIRTSTIDRYTAYNLALDGGWVNVDWVRGKENLPPLPNGEGKAYRKPGAAPALKPPNPEPTDATPKEGVAE